MRILVNASNLGPGGATQVADSFCCSLNNFQDDFFVVVLTPKMTKTQEKINTFPNVKVIIHGLKNNWKSYLFARENFLDSLVEEEKVDMVFSVFAPTWWTPRRPHLCGFALAHLVMPESPYYKQLTFKDFIKQKIHNKILTYFYRRCSDYYYSENPLISKRVQKLLRCKEVYTVTNYYNQVFDRPSEQHFKQLPPFDGITLLTITCPYPHKNNGIAVEIAKELKRTHPDFKFRFVFTFDKDAFCKIPKELEDCFQFIGRVDISECPSLYEQCDIVFQPTLLECFTATYPEAMRMQKPIVTTDLEFARGLCGNAALYYDALSAVDATEKIYKIANDNILKRQLVSNGIKQLKHFDNYNDRSSNLVSLCHEVYDSFQ